MDLTLTDEEREIREWVRTFVTKELMPLEAQVLERERNGERGIGLDELGTGRNRAKPQKCSEHGTARATATKTPNEGIEPAIVHVGMLQWV